MEHEARAAEAVTLYEAVPRERHRLGGMSLARMDLATTRLNREDLDGAALQIYDVIGVDARRRTESVRKRLGRFGRDLALHPAKTASAAVAMREAIITHQEQTPAELPPEGTR